MTLKMLYVDINTAEVNKQQTLGWDEQKKRKTLTNVIEKRMV